MKRCVKKKEENIPFFEINVSLGLKVTRETLLFLGFKTQVRNIHHKFCLVFLI